MVSRRAVHGGVTGADRHTKLVLVRGVMWGWAGSPDAAQRFLMLAEEHAGIDAAASRAALQEAAESCVRGTFALIEGRPELQLLLVSWNQRARKALILHVYDVGGVVRSVWVDDLDNVRMIGSERARALAQHALRTMGFADFQDVGLEEAKTLAHKLIADVAANSDDVGEPVHIGSVTAEKARRLDAPDIEGARDSAGRFTSGIRSLVGREPLPADTTTADEGIGPPTP